MEIKHQHKIGANMDRVLSTRWGLRVPIPRRAEIAPVPPPRCGYRAQYQGARREGLVALADGGALGRVGYPTAAFWFSPGAARRGDRCPTVKSAPIFNAGRASGK
jgi:hypothetical protein